MTLYPVDPEAALRVRQSAGAYGAPRNQRPYRLFSSRQVEEARARGQQPLTRFLDGRQALQVAQNLWEQEEDAIPAEAAGPPCARCDGPHLTSTCPDFPRPRANPVTDWLGVDSLDGFMAGVARAVKAASEAGPGGAPALRFTLVNTLYSDEEGAPGGHWVAVAFEIAPTSAPGA